MVTFEPEITVDAGLNAQPSGIRNRIRSLFVKRPYADGADLSGKTVIVTGASPRSIGFATARIPGVVWRDRRSHDALEYRQSGRADSREAAEAPGQ